MKLFFKIQMILSCQIFSCRLAVQAPVRDSLRWLKSGNEEFAHSATKRLLKQALFFIDYFTFANTFLQPSPKYNAFTAAT